MVRAGGAPAAGSSVTGLLLLLSLLALSRRDLGKAKPLPHDTNNPDDIPGDWRCCWGITSCAEHTDASCPPAGQSKCNTENTCNGPCGDNGTNTLWCAAAPAPGSEPGFEVPSEHDSPLRQSFRPPRQTAAQAATYQAIAAKAVRLSAEAKPGLLAYLGSSWEPLGTRGSGKRKKPETSQTRKPRKKRK